MLSPRHPRTAALLLGAALLSASLPLSAQSDADRATARDLAKEGLAKKKGGDCKGALDLLTRAQALYDAPTHLLAIAQCQAQLGQLVEAAETYRRLGRSDVGPKAPAAFKKAQEAGEKELSELAPRIATLVIHLEPDGVAGAIVSLDGEALPPQIIGVARSTNPGEHKLVAEAPGYETTKQTVKLKEGERVKTVITLRKLLVAPPPTSTAAPPTSASAAPPPPPPATSSAPPPPPPMLPPEEGMSKKTAGYVVGGLGAASVLVGGYFGLRAIGKKSDRDSACENKLCDSTGKAYEEEAFSAASLSNVFFGVGIVGLGVGTYLVLTSPSEKSQTALGIGPGSLRISGRF